MVGKERKGRTYRCENDTVDFGQLSCNFRVHSLLLASMSQETTDLSVLTSS